VVWLGDDLYPEGMPPEDDPTRAECERRLRVQADAGSQAGTQVFVPGNHDWKEGKKGGWDQVLRGEQFLEGYAGGANIWMPDGGCPGPVEVPLKEDIVLLVIDTQWWLHQYEKPGAESDCAAKTRAEMVQQLREAIGRNAGKRIIVAGHHPIYSYGAHGGHYSPATHLFPLLMARENLYVPLPVLGTMGVLYRKAFGSIQDIPHRQYRQLRDSLNSVFAGHPDLIYAAGHDHCLQYLPIGNQHHIVSGSGSKTRWTGHGKRADFTYAHKGFCRVDFYADGSVWMEFWVADAGKGPGGEVVFRGRVFDLP
jgi:hypothetical protein